MCSCLFQIQSKQISPQQTLSPRWSCCTSSNYHPPSPAVKSAQRTRQDRTWVKNLHLYVSSQLTAPPQVLFLFLPMPIHPGEASQGHPWALLAGSERLWWFCCPNQGLSVGTSNSTSPDCQPKVVLPIFLHVPVCWRPSGADDFLCLLPAFFFSFILFIISSTVEKTKQNQYKNVLH